MPRARSVKRVNKYSTNFYVDWMNEKFKTDYKAITELGDGYTYCNLLHDLFPNHMDISSLQKGNPQINWKKIEHCLKRLGIVKTIRMEGLSLCDVNEHTLFAAWFKEFYERNESKNEKLEYLLSWVSQNSSTRVRNLEELSNGFSYSLLFWKMQPKSIDVNKLIPPASCTDQECRKKNLRVLNTALKRFKITVPIDAISEMEHEACLRFLILFKNFCDMAKDVLKGKVSDQRRCQVTHADITSKIMDAATHVRNGQVNAIRFVNNAVAEFVPKMKAVKKTNSGVDGLFKSFRERCQHALLNHSERPSYLRYLDAKASNVHDIFVMAKVLNSMSKSKPKLIPDDIQQCTTGVVGIVTSGTMNLMDNLYKNNERVDNVVVHHHHPLKDLFYSMKSKNSLAVGSAEKLKTNPPSKSSDGRATQMWYQSMEATRMAEEILDHVDFMQRGRMSSAK